jgi:hypothetical protein
MVATLIEIALVAVVLYGVWNEKKLIAFEDKVIAKIKERLNVK